MLHQATKLSLKLSITCSTFLSVLPLATRGCQHLGPSSKMAGMRMEGQQDMCGMAKHRVHLWTTAGVYINIIIEFGSRVCVMTAWLGYSNKRIFTPETEIWVFFLIIGNRFRH